MLDILSMHLYIVEMDVCVRIVVVVFDLFGVLGFLNKTSENDYVILKVMFSFAFDQIDWNNEKANWIIEIGVGSSSVSHVYVSIFFVRVFFSFNFIYLSSFFFKLSSFERATDNANKNDWINK